MKSTEHDAKQIIEYLTKQPFKRSLGKNVRAALNLDKYRFSDAVKKISGLVTKEKLNGFMVLALREK